MAESPIKQVRMRLAQMEAIRQRWTGHWSEIKDYIAPYHGRYLNGTSDNEVNDGGKKHTKIYNGTASRALRTLTNGMYSSISSPSRPWFKLGTNDPALAKFPRVRDYLATCEKIMYLVFARGELYRSLAHTYYELGGFGTGVFAALESNEQIVKFRPYTVGEYWLAVNQELDVDTFYRQLDMTAAQMVQQFGIERVSSTVKMAYQNGKTEQVFKVIQAVEPNDDRCVVKDAQNRKFRSIYFEHTVCDEEPFYLEVKGYDEFPIMAPRWESIGRDVYGHSPGMEVLPDVKELQLHAERRLNLMDKQNNPPMVTPSKSKNINLLPGGINFDDTVQQGMGMRPLYMVQPDLQAIQLGIQEKTREIREGLYNDLFLMLASLPDTRRTATEIAERHSEKLIQLEPVLSNIHDDGLSPAIDRTFAVCLRNGVFPPAPEDLVGEMLKIEYVSVLAQAQKMVGVTAIEQVAGFVGNLSAVFPEARFKFDVKKAIDEYATAVGTTPSMIRSDEEVNKMVAAQQQQQAAQQNLQSAGVAAQSAKVMSEVNVTGLQNAMGALTGSPVAPGVPTQNG